MELRIGARRTGGIWHGYIEGRMVPDEDVRALTKEIAIEKAERIARRIAEKEGFLAILRTARVSNADDI
jgi:hypothetical protein